MRALEEGWEVTRVGNPPRLASSKQYTRGPDSKQYTRGPDRTVSRRCTVLRGDSGSLEATETFRFDSGELRNLLRDAVLTSGWTWRGVVFGKL